MGGPHAQRTLEELGDKAGDDAREHIARARGGEGRPAGLVDPGIHSVADNTVPSLEHDDATEFPSKLARGFGTLILCISAYLLIERRSERWGAAVLTLSILARPDSVILIGILGLVFFFLERESDSRLSPKFLGVWLAASAAVYYGVESHAESYGWWPLFHISFLTKEVHPAGIDPSVNWGAWWSVIRDKLSQVPIGVEGSNAGVGYWGTNRGVTGSSFVFVYAGFAVLALALSERATFPGRLRRHAAFLVALLATYFLRWLLFPQLWDRFFAPLYVLVPLCLLSMVAIAIEPLEHQKPSYERRPPMTMS